MPKLMPKDPKLQWKDRLGRAVELVRYHREWIEWCESNGRSYAGARGSVIRASDEAILKAAELQLEILMEKYHA